LCVLFTLGDVALLFTPEGRYKYSASSKHSEMTELKYVGSGCWDNLALNSIGCDFCHWKACWEIFHY